VVQYSLRELLRDKGADDILALTICEPAAGSGAFINEALNQLADAYLARKQAELGQSLSPDAYREERQKVKAWLAAHNAYGVDLNPTAIALAQVSIWLNTIYKGSEAPWFSARLAVGNSLIGARRAVYAAEDVLSGAYQDKAPRPVPVGQPRPAGSVYHWLLPDKGMAAFDRDRVIRQLAETSLPDHASGSPANAARADSQSARTNLGRSLQTIRQWRRDFTRRISRAELRNMQILSDLADDLWERHLTERRTLLARTRAPSPCGARRPPTGTPRPPSPPGKRSWPSSNAPPLPTAA